MGYENIDNEEMDEEVVPINNNLVGDWDWTSNFESDIKMWEPLIARTIVLSYFDGEAKLNEPPEMLGNTAGPMPFNGNVNIWG